MAGIVSIAMVVLAIVIASSAMEVVALISLFLWAALLGAYPTAWFDAIGKTAEQNALNLSEKTIALAGVVAIYFAPPPLQGPAIAGAVLLATRIASLTIQYGLWWRSLSGNDSFRKFSPRIGHSGISTQITVALLANASVVYGNQIALEIYGGRVELGTFGIAFQVVSLVLLFQYQALRLIAREIVRASEHVELIVSSMMRHAAALFLVSAALAVAAWVFMKYLPTLLDDPLYETIGEFALPLSAWAAIVGAGQVVSQYLVCTGGERTYLRITVAGAIATLASGMLLIPDGGGARMLAMLLLVIHTVMISLQGVVVFRNAGLSQNSR